LAAKGTGFGGGASLEKTGLHAACAGGTEAGAPEFIPRTLFLEGATGGADATGANFISFAGTRMADRATG